MNVNNERTQKLYAFRQKQKKKKRKSFCFSSKQSIKNHHEIKRKKTEKTYTRNAT